MKPVWRPNPQFLHIWRGVLGCKCFTVCTHTGAIPLLGLLLFASARLCLEKRQWIMFWRSSPFWAGVVGGGENSPGSGFTLYSSVYSSLIAQQNSADLKRIKIHERIRYASTSEGVRRGKKKKKNNFLHHFKCLWRCVCNSGISWQNQVTQQS